MSERGTALMAALVIIMILVPLGAFVALQSRLDLAIQYNLRTEVEAFYVAEAGLAHAVSEIEPGRSFDPFLLGPDHIAGTADDGIFPFRGGSPPPFPRAPYHYNVTAVRGRDGMMRIISRAMGEHGAVKVVEALVRRSASPHTPGAMYAEGDLNRLDLGSNAFAVSGLDHRAGDEGGNASGTHTAVPALCGTDPDAEVRLREKWSEDGDRLVGAGGSPSIGTTTPLGLGQYVTAMSQRHEAVMLPPTTVSSIALGTRAMPQLTLVGGALDVTGSLVGGGVLVVNGMLHVSGDLQFAGLVIAMGGIVFEPSSHVTIAGALWSGASQDERLELLGQGSVVYDNSALTAVDGAWPALLPHAVALAGWQEQL